jgi:hypothetical protein
MPPARNQVWERFRSDKKLLAEYRISKDELDFMETVALFGSLGSERDILFILKNIRPRAACCGHCPRKSGP